MKSIRYSNVLAGLLAPAMTMLLSPAALASGWLVVDPGLMPHPGHLPGHLIVRPGPGHIEPTPAPGHTVLHGGVSFGLHMQSEEVKVDISDQVAKTYITQVFSNDSDQNLAGTYLFPLPADTTFSSFSLQIDGKPIEGKILEAQEARQQYEAIVRQMIDPGLLEYADYKTVRARVFPIPAHGTKKIELEYTQLLQAEHGLLKYKFPLKAEEDAEPADEVKVDVKLASKQGLRTIWSPSHTISATHDGNNKAHVSFDEKNILPDKDFLLFYSVSDKDMAASVLTHKRLSEDGYFLLTLSPPVEAKTVESKDIVLVADTSGSMQGAKIEQARKALKYVVHALNPGDRFGIVQFNTDVDTFKNSLVDASVENKKKADAFVDDLEARGGTNISGAMEAGLTLLGESSTRPAYIVMVTDGEPTVGETDVQKLLASIKSKRDVRIFDFGVGDDVNVQLINKLAEAHHGTSQYVEEKENLESAVSSFYNKIKSPVLCDVHIDYDGVQVKDVYPREVKDIFAGSQVLLVGRYKNDGKATVHITGKLNGQSKSYNFPVVFNSEEEGHSYLPRIWAMRRIAHLTDVAQANGNNREMVDEIVALSRKYGIISAYTSFLVTDPNESMQRLGHRPMAMGAFLPGAVNGAPAMGGAGGASVIRGSLMNSRRESVNLSTLDARLANVPAPAAPPSSPLPQSKAARFQFQSNAWGSEKRAAKGASDTVYGDEGVRSVPSLSMGKALAQAAPMDAMYEVAAGWKGNTGHNAVAMAKSTSYLRDKDTIAEKKSDGSIRTAEDKTFYLVNGFWTDSEFDAAKQKMETIQFGSKQYFDLLHTNPGLRQYLSVARQMIVSYKGHVYKIVQPVSEAS